MVSWFMSCHPPKAEVDSLHPSPCAWECCVPAPGQPSLCLRGFLPSKMQDLPLLVPSKSSSGAVWAGGDNPCDSQAPGALAWHPGLLSLV